ncbi:MAG TPA: hypothetical protein VFI23_14270 [Rhizomicrobium sp.]|nr:hypothetical protein [Rhizomicrobium sp.]
MQTPEKRYQQEPNIMYVNVEIPELEKYQNGFPRYWLGLVFQNNAPKHYLPRALTTSYIRLVEGALRSYSSGREHVMYFWKGRDPAELPLSRLHAATVDYETCLTCLHRAILVMKRLRSRIDTPESYKRQVLKKPSFVSELISSRIRNVRDATQHVEALLADGTIPENTHFLLMADGIEVNHPTEPGQTIKTIDRLVVGSHTITFAELHNWLMEFGDYAEAISTYDFNPA